MTAETARAIISQALEDEMFEGEIPEDDSAAIEAAEGLVAMAKDAWEQNVQTPEVEALLNLAKTNGDGPAATTKPKPKPKPAAKPRPGRPTKKEPEPVPEDPRSQEEPWEGYDGDDVSAIVEGIEVWAEDNDLDSVKHVLLYEAAHKNRKKIVEKATELTGEEPPAPAEEVDAEPVEPDASAEDGDAEDTATPDAEDIGPQPDPTEEPFDGFAALKVSEVKGSMDEYLENDEVSDEDKLWTLKHVFAYESTHKTRTGLLDYIDEKMKTYTEVDGAESEGAEEDASAEASAEGDGDDATASGADAGAEDGDQGSEGDGEAARPAAAKRSRGSRGSADGAAAEAVALGSLFVVKATLPGYDAEFEAALTGKHGVSGLVLDLIEQGASSISVDAA